MELLEIIYGLLGSLSSLAAFVLFLITFSLTFDGYKSAFLKLQFKKIKERFWLNPIKGCLTAISFLIFISMALSYLVPVEVTLTFIIRSTTVRVPLIIAEVIVLWMVLHLEKHDRNNDEILAPTIKDDDAEQRQFPF